MAFNKDLQQLTTTFLIMNKQISLWSPFRLVPHLFLLGFFILNSYTCVFAQSSNIKLVKVAQELNDAFVNASPGDVIVMQNGTWNNIDILVKGNGTKEKPITLKAQTPGKVIISGKSSLRLSGNHLIVDGLYFKEGYSITGHLIRFTNGKEPANFSRITNIVVAKFNRPAADGAETWVSMHGTNNRVDHSFFYEKISAGRIITVWRPTEVADYHQIDHNYFKDIPVLGKNGAEVVGVGWSGNSLTNSHTVIEYNLLENCSGEGELFGLKSGKNIIRHNTIVRSQGSISLRHGNDNLVENNFIFGDKVNRTGGIRIMGERHTIRNNYVQGVRGARPAIGLIEGIENSPPHGYLQLKNIVVEGNVLVDNDLGIVVGDIYNPARKQIMPVLNSTIKNNVIVGGDEKSQLIQVLDEPINMVYQNNIVHHGLSVEKAGIKREDPGLVNKNGIFQFSQKNMVTKIVGSPLKRTEVGPSWIKGMWEELGIKDIPYISK
jgi:poly(beta-D-mannuronate) lyase